MLIQRNKEGNRTPRSRETVVKLAIHFSLDSSREKRVENEIFVTLYDGVTAAPSRLSQLTSLLIHRGRFIAVKLNEKIPARFPLAIVSTPFREIKQMQIIEQIYTRRYVKQERKVFFISDKSVGNYYYFLFFNLFIVFFHFLFFWFR